MKLLPVFLLALCIILVQVDGSPKRRKGSSSGWFGSSKKDNKNSWSGSGRKSSKGKTLKKAAMIGAGAYVGYQLGKATGRFGGWHHGGGWGWNDYNRWRQQDGMLCRNNQDCTWMDPSMHCEDYELDFDINRGWYGGDYLAVVGECECDTWSKWDNWELECEFSFFAMIGTIFTTVFLVSLCLCCGCCAAGGYWMFRRK